MLAPKAKRDLCLLTLLFSCAVNVIDKMINIDEMNIFKAIIRIG
jgi:hypothetical protein